MSHPREATHVACARGVLAPSLIYNNTCESESETRNEQQQHVLARCLMQGPHVCTLGTLAKISWGDLQSIYSILHLGDRRGLPCIVLDSRVGLVHLWSLALVLRFFCGQG